MIAGDRLVAYIQNLPNRYAPLLLINLLFANDNLTKNEEFMRIVNEAVKADPRAPKELVDDEKFEEEVRKWNENLAELAAQAP